MVGKPTTQPGVEISEQLWKRFRQEVENRRGRINGVLGAELENAIESYLEGAEGGDVTDELRRLREDIDDIADAVGVDADEEDEVDPSPSASRDATKEKNSARGKDAVTTEASTSSSDEVDVEVAGDGGTPVDDRHLYDDGDDGDDDRSAVEKRTDAAVAELVTNFEQFTLSDLDDAIETGADVHSKPSIRDYRERVFDRLGGIDENALPATVEKPLESTVWFVDADEANARRAADLAYEEGETIADAAAEYDLEEDRVRDALAAADLGAILVRDDGLDVSDAADRTGADVESIIEKLPDDLASDDVDDDGDEFVTVDDADSVGSSPPADD
ncbi:MAG: hypothetical protein SV760_09620 [Halobacteria archaeon]|nr:hypothetical protein [Halobacteria archaeon]